MAIDSATYKGSYIGNDRYAMVVVKEGVEWYEEWLEEGLVTGQWHRNSKVSDLLSERLAHGMSSDFAANLPRVNNEDLPGDFFRPQGEITVEMYPGFAPAEQHDAIVLTTRVNYFKARREAKRLGAWYVKKTNGQRIYGLLAQLPSDTFPRFYTWKEFSEALEQIVPPNCIVHHGTIIDLNKPYVSGDVYLGWRLDQKSYRKLLNRKFELSLQAKTHKGLTHQEKIEQQAIEEELRKRDKEREAHPSGVIISVEQMFRWGIDYGDCSDYIPPNA
jgi:hypothetical protein